AGPASTVAEPEDAAPEAIPAGAEVEATSAAIGGTASTVAEPEEAVPEAAPAGAGAEAARASTVAEREDATRDTVAAEAGGAALGSTAGWARAVAERAEAGREVTRVPAGGGYAGGEAAPVSRAGAGDGGEAAGARAVAEPEAHRAPAGEAAAGLAVADREHDHRATGAGDGREGGTERRRRGAAPWAVAVAVLVLLGLTALVLRMGTGSGDDDDAQRTTSTTAATGTGAPAGEGGSPAPTAGGTPRSTSTTPTTSTTTTSRTTTTTSAVGAVPAGWTRYTDPAIGYTIAHPPGWEVRPVDATRTDFRDPATGTYLRVDWTNEPRPDPVADWRSQSEGFAAGHEGYEEISIAPFTYRDYNAALWEFRYREGGAVLHAGNLGFVAGPRGYALYFQTHEADWASSQTTYERFRAAFAPAP
ncbi:MAG TPA: hypothetical protein VF743_07430, partial [Acidimicrobiales bacterium]